MKMHCWKCGQELTDGAGNCVYCGAKQARSEPSSEVGKALRMLYDRYGRDAVLTNNLFLVNGLGDLVEDCQKLRNQFRAAMDAGMGRMYLDQLNATGAPDASFDTRVRNLLTEEAGLSDTVTGGIIGYMDEMIGWRNASKVTDEPEPPREAFVESHAEIVRETGKPYKRDTSDKRYESQPQRQDTSQPKQSNKSHVSKRRGHPGLLTMGIMCCFFSLIWIRLYFLKDEPVTPKIVISHCFFIAMAAILLALYKKGIGGE